MFKKIFIIFIFLFLITTKTNAVFTVPSGVTSWYNISVNNQQTTAIPANFQLQIPINALNMSSSANSIFANYEIFNGFSSNLITSWLEGNAYKPTQFTSLNTIGEGNLIIWANLDIKIPASTNAVNVISIGFAGMSTITLNSVIGESPILSNTPILSSNTYGKYDNGANVFINYQSWGSLSSLPSSWTSTSGAMLTFTSTNIILKSGTAGSPNAIYFTSENGLPYSYNTPGNIVDSMVNFSGSFWQKDITLNPPTASAPASVWAIEQGNGCTGAPFLCFKTWKGASYLSNVLTPNSLGISNTFVLSFSYTSSTTGNAYADYNTLTAIGLNSQNPLAVNPGNNAKNSFEYYINSATQPLILYLTRTRTMPPNDAPPQITFTAKQTSGVATVCTFVTSNAAINFGTITQGTNTIGTSGSYNVITVTNTGTSTSNILLSGSNWNFNSNSFTVTNTIWSGTAANSLWNPQASSIQTGTANVEVQLTGSSVDTLQFTSNSATATNTLWFGANVPSGSSGGTWSQTINVISSC